jgi:hypothetical protein
MFFLDGMNLFVVAPNLEFDVEEVALRLREFHGNVTECARTLNVNPQRLRAFVRNTPELNAELEEAGEELVDDAERVIRSCLKERRSATRRDFATRFVLSTLGKHRKWSPREIKLALNTENEIIEISWAKNDNDDNNAK